MQRMTCKDAVGLLHVRCWIFRLTSTVYYRWHNGHSTQKALFEAFLTSIICLVEQIQYAAILANITIHTDFVTCICNGLNPYIPHVYSQLTTIQMTQISCCLHVVNLLSRPYLQRLIQDPSLIMSFSSFTIKLLFPLLMPTNARIAAACKWLPSAGLNCCCCHFYRLQAV